MDDPTPGLVRPFCYSLHALIRPIKSRPNDLFCVVCKEWVFNYKSAGDLEYESWQVSFMQPVQEHT